MLTKSNYFMTQYKKILIVNLEDTLLKSDIFLETFWSAFAKDPLIPIKIFFLILKGKNDFRKYLDNWKWW